jgi:4-carboxymuconolactone decarboxylase
MSTPPKSAEPASAHRLPVLPPDVLTDEQRSLATNMKEGIAKSFQGFVNVRHDGALLGPWNPWLHHPKFGEPIWT